MKALAKLAKYEAEYRKYKERLLQFQADLKCGANTVKPVPPVPSQYLIKTLAEVFMAEKIREQVDKELTK